MDGLLMDLLLPFDDEQNTEEQLDALHVMQAKAFDVPVEKVAHFLVQAGLQLTKVSLATDVKIEVARLVQKCSSAVELIPQLASVYLVPLIECILKDTATDPERSELAQCIHALSEAVRGPVLEDDARNRLMGFVHDQLQGYSAEVVLQACYSAIRVLSMDPSTLQDTAFWQATVDSLHLIKDSNDLPETTLIGARSCYSHLLFHLYDQETEEPMRLHIKDAIIQSPTAGRVLSTITNTVEAVRWSSSKAVHARPRLSLPRGGKENAQELVSPRRPRHRISFELLLSPRPPPPAGAPGAPALRPTPPVFAFLPNAPAIPEAVASVLGEVQALQASPVPPDAAESPKAQVTVGYPEPEREAVDRSMLASGSESPVAERPHKRPREEGSPDLWYDCFAATMTSTVTDTSTLVTAEACPPASEALEAAPPPEAETAAVPLTGALLPPTLQPLDAALEASAGAPSPARTNPSAAPVEEQGEATTGECSCTTASLSPQPPATPPTGLSTPRSAAVPALRDGSLSPSLRPLSPSFDLAGLQDDGPEESRMETDAEYRLMHSQYLELEEQHASLRARQDALQEEYAAVLQQSQSRKETIAELSTNAEWYQGRIRDLEQELTEQRNRYDGLYANATGKLAIAERELNERDVRLHTAERESSQLKQESAESSATLKLLKDQVAGLQMKLDATCQELCQAKERIQREQLEAAQARVTAEDRNLAVQTALQQLADKEKVLQDVQRQSDARQNTLNAEISLLKARLAERDAELLALQEKTAPLQRAEMDIEKQSLKSRLLQVLTANGAQRVPEDAPLDHYVELVGQMLAQKSQEVQELLGYCHRLLEQSEGQR